MICDFGLNGALNPARRENASLRDIVHKFFHRVPIAFGIMASSDLPDGVDEEAAARLLRRVLEAEENKLYMESPMGINNDIQAILEEEIK